MTAVRPFPLVPRRRFVGAEFGDRRSRRRGRGDEVAGARPYRRGDHIGWIDWKASARVSAAHGEHEFVVRQYFADRAAQVVLVCDRSATLDLYRPPLPFLDKGAAAGAAARLVAASAMAARARLAYVDHAVTAPVPAALGRASRDRVAERLRSLAFDGPRDGLGRSLRVLGRHGGGLSAGAFVFVVSDFVEPLDLASWVGLRGFHWDVVPVVVQDAVWEQSFPAVGGVVLPLADAATREVVDVLVTRSEARRRARANEERLRATLAVFTRLGFDPILLGTADEDEISARFAAWAARRRRLWGLRA